MPEDDPEGRSLQLYFVAEAVYACGGATNNGGNVLQWLFENVLRVGEMRRNGSGG